jgi:hypothetical protein
MLRSLTEKRSENLFNYRSRDYTDCLGESGTQGQTQTPGRWFLP